MADRKLLILTYHFPPSAASGTFRLLGFVSHLPQFGWRSVVVAPPELPWEPVDQALMERIPAETALYHVLYPEGLLWKPLRRLSPLGIWLPKAWAACRRAIHEHHTDALLTSGPPHLVHLLGRELRNRYGLPWIADFRDPWVAGVWSTSSEKTGRKRWEFRAEGAVMRDADAIVANTPGACDLLGEAYPEHGSKMVSITNGYDPESFEANPVPPLAGQSVEITHLGEIYVNRDPGPFLEAIRSIRPNGLSNGRSLRVRFIGRLGDSSPRLEHLIRAGGLEGVVDLGGQIPYDESLRAMVQADVLLLLDSPGRKAGVPAKLYEYLGARRPILALGESDGDLAWVLRESGVPYRIAPPRAPGAIQRALLELLEDPATAAFGSTDTPAPTRFTREYLTGELAGLLDSLVERRSRKSASALLSAPAL